MIKGKTYHELLKQYIQSIGCTDCPAKQDEASGCCGELDGQATRTVGRVVERDGAWEIHLITVDARCPCRLKRSRLRTFRSRKMAEIVARYTAASRTSQPKPGPGEALPFCWN